MAKLLFKLKNVFDDEADDIRQLLTDEQIDFYESPAGNWGISMHALWLNDETQYSDAKQLIDEYQLERSRRIQKEVQQQKADGEFETLLQRILHRPVQFLVYSAFILFMLYISIMPFLEIGQ
ncbi:MAG: DUF6164 family protein [Gammaproteobacteria bacterium]|nr:DUF6164 family protein [Gammaproteobacteria bacterium]